MAKDYYQVLGISRDAGNASIRNRWRELARKFHPDHNPGDPTAEEQFKEILEAYRILSDPALRKRYDHGALDRPGSVKEPTHYFYASCNEKKVKCFEEVHLTYTYSGNGRTLIKPDLSDFFTTGSPFVAHRSVVLEGNIVKETHLTYIICPMKAGELTIGKASINIQLNRLESESFTLQVLPNICQFTKNTEANGKPFKITMHYEFLPGEEPFRISEKKKNHTILVPRSRSAYLFHGIGSGLKAVCTLYGLIMLSQYFDFNFLAGMACGNLIGGINCTIMYRLAGVRSKFAASSIYPLISEYHDRGYLLGESTGFPFKTGDFLYHFFRILL